MQHRHIKFQNQQNPNSRFDIVALEDLLNRKDLDHSLFELHLVEFYIIIFVTEGTGHHTIDFTKYKIKKGSLLTIRKDQIHQFHPSSSLKGKLLIFTDEFLISYLEKTESLKSLQLFNDVLALPKVQLNKNELDSKKELINRINKEYFDESDDYSLGIIRSELQILIAKLFRIKAIKNDSLIKKKYLEEFIQFQSLIEQHATQYSKVKDYSKIIGTSTKTLNTITQTIVNKTAKEFIDEISTTQIKRLLINTSLSIKEIAHASGFEESTNFYKYFKRQMNTTPEQFRNSIR